MKHEDKDLTLSIKWGMRLPPSGGLQGTLHRKRLSFMGLVGFVNSLRVQMKSEYKGISVVQRV